MSITRGRATPPGVRARRVRQRCLESDHSQRTARGGVVFNRVVYSVKSSPVSESPSGLQMCNGTTKSVKPSPFTSAKWAPTVAAARCQSRCRGYRKGGVQYGAGDAVGIAYEGVVEPPSWQRVRCDSHSVKRLLVLSPADGADEALVLAVEPDLLPAYGPERPVNRRDRARPGSTATGPGQGDPGCRQQGPGTSLASITTRPVPSPAAPLVVNAATTRTRSAARAARPAFPTCTRDRRRRSTMQPIDRLSVSRQADRVFASRWSDRR